MRMAVDGDEAVIREAKEQDQKNELLAAGQNPDEVLGIEKQDEGVKKVIPKKKAWTRRFEEGVEEREERFAGQLGPDAQKAEGFKEKGV